MAILPFFVTAKIMKGQPKNKPRSETAGALFLFREWLCDRGGIEKSGVPLSGGEKISTNCWEGVWKLQNNNNVP